MKIRILSAVGESHPLMEDFHLFQYSAGKIKVAVGDWANNLVGGPFFDSETSSLLGQNSISAYNGGVIGSLMAKKAILNSEKTGYSLAEAVNNEIRAKYVQLVIKNPENNRPVTFTGYIGHAIAPFVLPCYATAWLASRLPCLV